MMIGMLGVACTTASGGDPDGECGRAPTGFDDRYADVNGVRLHYVIGGRGPAVVLLHGFPETWWTWREVMPLLTGTHTVVAPDLRGIGCSSLESGGFDTTTLARDVHALTRALGIRRAALVGHDIGGWVAYAYARQFRDEVSHLVLSGAVIPGFGLDRLLDFRQPGQGLPHLPFFMQPRIPEQLIGGRERQYFGEFVNSEPIARSGAIDFYARSYARPGRLTAALGQYRAIYVDAADNVGGAGPSLRMPTLAISGTGLAQQSADSLRKVAVSVSQQEIPDAGHYVQEDQPDAMAQALIRFLR